MYSTPGSISLWQEISVALATRPLNPAKITNTKGPGLTMDHTIVLLVDVFW